MKNNLKKNIIWNSIGSTVNACVSLFLLILVTRINGVEQAGIFTFSYSLACLLQVIISYAGRPFHVTERDSSIKDSDFFYSRLVTAVITFIIAFFYVIFKGYEVYKILIIFLALAYRASDALSDCFYAILQKKDQLYKVGISLLIKGIICTLVFVICDLLTKNLVLSLILMTVINIIICYFYDYLNTAKTKFKFEKPNTDKILIILKKGFSVFAFTILIQYLVGAQKYAIDGVLEEEFQTIFGIILMPATVIVLISQFIVQPYLTKVTDLIKNKKYKELNSLVIRMSLYILLFSAAAVVGAYLLGTQVLSLVYGIELVSYRVPLCLILIGASLFALSYVLSSVMMALRFNTGQLVIYIIVSIFTFFESAYLVKSMQIQGATLAYLISMSVLLVLYIGYYLFLKKGLGKK